MAHVRDRWTDPNPSGTKPKRVPNARWGKGKRWQARWIDPTGADRSRAFATKDEAEVHVASVVAGVPAAAASGLTLATWARGWQGQQIDHRPTTARNTATHLARIIDTMGSRDLAGITRADVQAAVAAWSGELAATTTRATYTTLATVLRAAVRDDLIAKSPCVRIKLPPVERGRIEPFSRAQVDAMRDAMTPHLASMVTVGAATGLRLGELRGLTEDRLTRTTLTVDRQRTIDGLGWGPPKTPAAHRTISLPAVARDAIRDHLKTYGHGPDGLIWRTMDDRPLRHQVGVQSWERARDRLPEGTVPARGGWHDLRHFCASLLIAKGLSVRLVADWLGHDDPSITLRTYSHLWPTDQRAAADAIDAALG